MKLIKKKMLYMAVLALLGAGFVAMGLYQGKSMLSGIGSGLLAVSLLKIIQYMRISKNPERLRELEIVQNEERLIFLSNRACALSYYAIIIIEYIVMIVCMLTGYELIASICAYAVCGELILYLIIRAILNKKY